MATGLSQPLYIALHQWRHGQLSHIPDSKLHGANMGLIWGRQDPGGPHVGPMNLVIWNGTVNVKWLILDDVYYLCMAP